MKARRHPRAVPGHDVAELAHMALARLLEGAEPADVGLRRFFAAHPDMGRNDRGRVAEAVWDILRNRRLYAHVAQSGRGPLAARLLEVHAARDRIDAAALPRAIRLSLPDWLDARLAARWPSEQLEALGASLLEPAPLDLRVNLLKCDPAQARAKLAHLAPAPTPLSPLGLRIEAGPGRGPALAAETAFVKGLVEPQDEASQLASLLCAAEPGAQVLDLCAGGGGKALALAAQMHNRGQIYAYDSDGRRLMPIHARLERAGARNIQVRAPRGQTDVLADLAGRCDLVLIDAPCTGTGVWRRHPDAKWRLAPGALTQRVAEQAALLVAATRFAKPGGRIAYVTCSLLIEENEGQIAAFLAAHPDFVAIAAGTAAAAAGLPDLARFASPHGAGFRFSPAQGGADGFYVALLQKGGPIP